MRNFTIMAGVCALAVAGTAQAAKPVQLGTPAQVKRLMDCRAIAAADQRLACFDREATAMDAAKTAVIAPIQVITCWQVLGSMPLPIDSGGKPTING